MSNHHDNEDNGASSVLLSMFHYDGDGDDDDDDGRYLEIEVKKAHVYSSSNVNHDYLYSNGSHRLKCFLPWRSSSVETFKQLKLGDLQ